VSELCVLHHQVNPNEATMPTNAVVDAQHLGGSPQNQARGPRVWLGAPWVGLCSAVSYSPTPWRVQYHRRWRA
jgi:hypothetical protein